MNLWRPLGVVALLALFSVAVLGCGGTVIDATKAEETIKASLESKRSLDRKLAAVECPGGVKVQAGASFECALEFAGGEKATAVLKIRDSEADVNLEDVLPHSVARAAESGSK